LTKTHGNEQILVVFNVNHSVGMEESDENPEAAPIPVALPPFSIEITKGDQRLCFNLEMMEAGEEGHFDFRVEEFYIAPAAKENNEEVADQVYASSGQYIDPDLHDILFVRYLEERWVILSQFNNPIVFLVVSLLSSVSSWSTMPLIGSTAAMWIS
jgi:hypothetical protein